MVIVEGVFNSYLNNTKESSAPREVNEYKVFKLLKKNW